MISWVLRFGSRTSRPELWRLDSRLVGIDVQVPLRGALLFPDVSLFIFGENREFFVLELVALVDFRFDIIIVFVHRAYLDQFTVGFHRLAPIAPA